MRQDRLQRVGADEGQRHRLVQVAEGESRRDRDTLAGAAVAAGPVSGGALGVQLGPLHLPLRRADQHPRQPLRERTQCTLLQQGAVRLRLALACGARRPVKGCVITCWSAIHRRQQEEEKQRPQKRAPPR